MTYKTILAHCDASKNAHRHLASGVDLAERFNSVFVGLHPRPPFETPAFVEDSFAMGPLFEAYEKGLAEDTAVARAAFDAAIKGRAMSSEWRAIDGIVEDVMTTAARYSDLVVVGQTSDDNDFATPGDLPEVIALSSGRPVLVVPYAGTLRPPGAKILLCWNASRESARIAVDALPFLREAQEVVVLIVDPHPSQVGHGEEPGADVALWLARHGVKVRVQRDTAGDADVGNIILSRAADEDVDLIAMGVYGHSRVREMVLGGASRVILSSMTVPVLMSH